MSELRYLSLFSGIGGLEHPTIRPQAVCEWDAACQQVLRRRYPGIGIHGDIAALHAPPPAEIVVGGWPCQDISSAGTLSGIMGSRSGLFFEMLRVARASGAHTLIGENVPNLLTINKGHDFQIVLEALAAEGYRFVAWRTLNARAFGLPQERRRLFVVASRYQEPALALHAALPELPPPRRTGLASGFYWTAGARSICFSAGYSPAIKIGATDEKGRAPVAVLFGSRVRKLTPEECLRLQGFGELPLEGLSASVILRMAGNAVPAPVGHFVIESVTTGKPSDGVRSAFGRIGPSGMIDDGMTWVVEHAPSNLATDLVDFIDLESTESLSPQAAAGLIVRSVRSGNPMPHELFDLLLELAADRTRRIVASRGNSFEALDSMREEVADYVRALPTVAHYDEAVSSGATRRRPIRRSVGETAWVEYETWK